MRTFSGEAGLLSSSIGSALMDGVEMVSSGFEPVTGEIGVSDADAMPVCDAYGYCEAIIKILKMSKDSVSDECRTKLVFISGLRHGQSAAKG